MTLEEVIDLLADAAAFDRRNIGENDSVAWYAAIGDLPFADAQAAVIAHYRESREFIMPADVRSRVKRKQRDEADRGRIREILDPAAYRKQVEAADAAFMRKLAERTGGREIKAVPEPDYDGAQPKAIGDD